MADSASFVLTKPSSTPGEQPAALPNRDSFYSVGVFDLTEPQTEKSAAVW